MTRYPQPLKLRPYMFGNKDTWLIYALTLEAEQGIVVDNYDDYCQMKDDVQNSINKKEHQQALDTVLTEEDKNVILEDRFDFDWIFTDYSVSMKQWRKRLKITQVQASSYLSVPLKTYQGYEQGRNVSRPVFKLMTLIYWFYKNDKMSVVD